MSEEFIERLFARTRELQAAGLDPLHATGIADLEERIRAWPSEWGDDLHVLLYGDFEAPDQKLIYPSDGITVLPDKRENTVITGPLTVLKAIVSVRDKSVDSVIEAGKRINLLLGVYTLHQWGNTGSGWWSWVTHGSSAGAITKLADDGIEHSIITILNLPPKVQKKVEAALYWVREPRNTFRLKYRSDTLRMYSAYWNAFECLVEAVNLIRPRTKLSGPEKQAQINEFVRQRAGRLTVADIQDCYKTIVNQGLFAEASHALKVCFGNDADRYIQDCFRVIPEEERLYNVRNAINHGSIDAENPNEVLRVEAKLILLWMMVWRMFGRIVPIPVPVPSDSK